MIKTQLFSGYFTGIDGKRRFVDIDTEINSFLENSGNIEVVDIKYVVSVDLEGKSWNKALLIYKGDY